jgi:hypothetical protein
MNKNSALLRRAEFYMRRRPRCWCGGRCGVREYRVQKSGAVIGWECGAFSSMFGAGQRRMIMTFRIQGLPAERFSHLFALSDQELAAHGAVRQIAGDRKPGYPGRVSLTDSQAGDELILVNHEHHPVDSPYRMRFAIYVRKGEQTYDEVGRVPEQLRSRTLAVRAFDTDAMMVGWELVEGSDLEAAIARRFADQRAAYLHIHFAAPGCYAARVERS